MTDPTPTSDLRERLADALYRWALDAAGASRISPPVHPRTLENLYANSLARADAVLPVVEAALAEQTQCVKRAEADRDSQQRLAIGATLQRDEQRARAEEAERQRDEALAAVQRVRDLHNGGSSENTVLCVACCNILPCPTIAALDQPEETP